MRLLLLLVALAVVDAATSPIKINGWYACSARTFATRAPANVAPSTGFKTTAFSGAEPDVLATLLRPLDASSVADLAMATTQATSSVPVECAEFTLPLCYESLCNTAGSIPVFVKRMRATKRTSSTKALWFLQGGPGARPIFVW
ncbi:hypothetical protein SDRG_03942 [Saprolegnia diclina VS20]|uniref:Uncharacterized protein n=1 Tax=Saprolegnia diclina (strain VS20) TaxID=1156394 RepID=T0QLS5_SAPDV|nr:hypothetical protein SDRG_03942 [Saprolegnia diclina VS20]EQC38989.1 hypothetical protein SDRG_03942 [Saprolegnia diclina VS20]|eukprot:XP_008607813.1 hypothetical protein SDRG_03942 [Saprolegnia diclina VS20]